MDTGVLVAFCAAALVVGATGTWSPCGFSMIETLGPTGHTGGRRTTLAACLTFLPGALAGGIATFGVLGAAGAALPGFAGEAAYLVAGALALAAAALEARGVPILPQVRRQLPEHWRRVLPMPLAAALYGVLLGLGFTTFVLSYGVWALMGIAFAGADVQAAALAGLAFGAGRALPVVALAPIAGSPAGIRITELMAGRPGLYRWARAGDAMALAGLAALLITAAPAAAERTESRDAADPGVVRDDLVFQRPDRSGVLRRDGNTQGLPGADPAIGGPYIAVRAGQSIRLLRRSDLEQLAVFNAGPVNAVAVARQWLVWRTERDGADRIRARRITKRATGGPVFKVAHSRSRHLSAPNVSGSRVVFASAGKRDNRIVRRVLRGGPSGAVVRSRRDALLTPSIHKRSVLYSRHTPSRQRLVLKWLGGGARTLFSRGVKRGFLLSTALGPRRAYATVKNGARTKVISVKR